MKSVVAYARFSSDNQREESITAQTRAIDECAERRGYVINKVYADEAKSAKTDNRPAFLQLMSDVKAHKISVVFVHKLDRFCRNRYDSAFYKKILKDNGVILISVLENIDDSPESIILESVLEGMAEYYSANLAREVKKGLKENALQCKHTGGYPPYGYSVNHDKNYIVNEKEAVAIRKIFDMVCHMATSTSICEWLENNHYSTRTGNKFTKSALTNIIPNEKYKGVYVYNQYKRQKIDGITKDIKNDNETIIRVPDGVPRIVSNETWEKANSIFKTRKRVGRPTGEDRVYLLSGLLFCGLCNNHLVGEHTNSRGNRASRTIYNCIGKKVKNICTIKAIRKDTIESIVIDAVDKALSIQSIENAVEQLYSQMKSFNLTIPGEIKSLTGELTKIKNKINKVIDLMIESDSTPSLNEKLKQLENERTDIEEKILYYQEKQRQYSLPSKKYMKQSLRKDLHIKEKSPNEQKRIIGTYVKKIIVYPEYIDIFMDRVIEYGDEAPVKAFSKNRGEYFPVSLTCIA